MTEVDRAHNFNEALKGYGLDLETIALILEVVKERYQLTGSWPTPEQIRTVVLQPGL